MKRVSSGTRARNRGPERRASTREGKKRHGPPDELKSEGQCCGPTLTCTHTRTHTHIHKQHTPDHERVVERSCSIVRTEDTRRHRRDALTRGDHGKETRSEVEGTARDRRGGTGRVTSMTATHGKPESTQISRAAYRRAERIIDHRRWFPSKLPLFCWHEDRRATSFRTSPSSSYSSSFLDLGCQNRGRPVKISSPPSS